MLTRRLLFCLPLLLLVLPALAQNRIKNPGMEDLTAASQFQLAQTTGEWWLNPGYPARVTAIDDPRVAHSGKLSLRVVPFDRTVGEEGKPPREGAVSQQLGALNPGEKYFVRFWARGLGTVAAFAYQYDKNGWKGSTTSPNQQLSTNWREYRWYYTVPEGVTNGQLAFHISPGGLMYLDDVSFTPIAAIPAPPAITETDVNGDGKPEFVMENPTVKIAVDPRRGAQVISVFRKFDKAELIPLEAKSGGLFSDHDVSQPWPGEYMNAPYTAEKVDLQDGSAAVRFTYTTSSAKATQMSGLRLQKTISLLSDAPAIRCDVAFTNPTAEGRAVQYWMQNFVTSAGDPVRDWFVRPSATGGLSMLSTQQTQPEFVRDPTAGWTAISSLRGSVIFTMDYDNLDVLYNCGPCKPGATTEWMLSKVAIPAGKTWQTTVWALLSYVQSPLFASPDLVIGSGRDLEGQTAIFINSFAAATRPLARLEDERSLVQVTMRYDTPTGKTVPVEKVDPMPAPWGPKGSVDLIGWTPAPDNGRAQVSDGLWVLRLKVTGEALAAQVDAPLRVGMAAPQYQTTPPPKLVLRFEPEKLAIERGPKLRVLLIQDEFVKPILARWKLQEILKAMPGPPEVTVSVHSYIGWKMAGQLTFFPALMEDLLKYQVIILESPDAAAFSPSEQEMLRDYVKAGGGILVLGGYYSYGKGRWEGTTLGGIMPVKTKGPWDLVEVKAALEPSAPNPRLKDLALPGPPRAVWVHDVEPLPGAPILATAGGKPLLVASPAGPGKVLCFTGTILGYEDKAGGTPFWKWDQYPAFLQSLITWLGSEQ